MATKFFLRGTVTSDIDPTAADDLLASLTQVADAQAKQTSTVAGPTSGVQLHDNLGSGNDVEWYTNPLSAVTISGTITFNVWGSESGMNANVGPQVIVERCDGSGSVISTVIDSEKGTELPTVEAAQNWTGTPTSTTLSDGDRLRIRLMGNDGGGTMASGFTFLMRPGGGTPGSTGDTWVQFNETITEFVAVDQPFRQPMVQLLAH